MYQGSSRARLSLNPHYACDTNPRTQICVGRNLCQTRAKRVGHERIHGFGSAYSHEFGYGQVSVIYQCKNRMGERS